MSPRTCTVLENNLDKIRGIETVKTINIDFISCIMPIPVVSAAHWVTGYKDRRPDIPAQHLGWHFNQTGDRFSCCWQIVKLVEVNDQGNYWAQTYCALLRNYFRLKIINAIYRTLLLSWCPHPWVKGLDIQHPSVFFTLMILPSLPLLSWFPHPAIHVVPWPI